MGTKTFSWTKLIPIAVIIIGLIAFYYFDLYRYFSFDTLQKHHNDLMQWRTNHPISSALIFMGVYVVAVAFSFPGATFITLAVGFLFGIVLGTIYVVVAATLGACIIFLAARYAFADLLLEKAGKWLVKMEKGFQENAFSYLLFLRLIPLFPFWLVNIVPALLNVRLRTYFIATFFGIIPGSLVYVSIGNGLSSVFKQGETLNLGIIFEPQILIPLVALAILSLVPIIYKKIKREKTSS